MEDAEFLRFGAYKGESVHDLVNEKPRYLQWLLDQDWLKDALRAEVEKALANRQTFVLDFGKWSGSTVDQVAEEDPGYLEWLLEQDWVEDKLHEYIEGVL